MLFRSRVGGVGRFGIAARPTRGGRIALGLIFLSDNLTTRAQGVIDPKTRRSTDEGLKVSVETPSVSRLAGTDAAGAARFDGVLTGDAYDFHLKGIAAVEKARVGGYGLAQISGPVDLLYRNGRYDLDLKAQGNGGSGKGVLAAALGGKPTAEAKLVVFPNGALLLDRVEARGPGLKLTGAGGRNLLGGYNFSGRAVLSNLGVVKRGAGGELDVAFRASRAPRAYPWVVTADARGRRFATGLGQLDRLLGPSPRLQGQGTLDHNRIELAKATLDGKAGEVRGAGLIGLNGTLKLALNWSAKGPFAAGPVEIAGAAKGSGSLTGTFLRPRADLKASFDQIDAYALTLTQAQVALTFAKDARGYDEIGRAHV